MTRKKDCTVYIRDGPQKEGVGVLIKDSGWVRIGEDNGTYRYYPPQMIESRVYEPEGLDG